MGNTHGDHRDTVAALEADIVRVQVQLTDNSNPNDDTASVIHAGYLNKQGEGAMAFLRWQKRWFVVTSNGLIVYYEDKDAADTAAPLGAVKCSEVISVTCLPHGTDIHIEDAHRVYSLSVADPGARYIWVQVHKSALLSPLLTTTPTL